MKGVTENGRISGRKLPYQPRVRVSKIDNSKGREVQNPE
jgi:hypothetical protein